MMNQEVKKYGKNMAKKYTNLERGDIVWIDFSPTKGHEQSGLRPAVIISGNQYNSFSNLVLACPVTTKQKDYFFKVKITGLDKDSFVLVDQVRTFDIKERVKKITGKINNSEMNEILAKVGVLFQ